MALAPFITLFLPRSVNTQLHPLEVRNPIEKDMICNWVSRHSMLHPMLFVPTLFNAYDVEVMLEVQLYTQKTDHTLNTIFM